MLDLRESVFEILLLPSIMIKMGTQVFPNVIGNLETTSCVDLLPDRRDNIFAKDHRHFTGFDFKAWATAKTL